MEYTRNSSTGWKKSYLDNVFTLLLCITQILYVFKGGRSCSCFSYCVCWKNGCSSCFIRTHCTHFICTHFRKGNNDRYRRILVKPKCHVIAVFSIWSLLKIFYSSKYFSCLCLFYNDCWCIYFRLISWGELWSRNLMNWGEVLRIVLINRNIH